jgi:hypothetical protein
MSPRGKEDSGAYGLLKKVGGAAMAVLAVVGLCSMIVTWAWGEIQKPLAAERAAREVAISQLVQAQQLTNETLVELVTVMVAPNDVKLRTMRRLRAKYEIGVTQ